MSSSGRVMNYRRLLLQAVDLFLEQSARTSVRAQRIVQRCLHAERPFSLDSIVWGGAISALTDEVYNANIPYLLALRDELAGNSATIARTYVKYNFREEFTLDEGLWLEKAQELITFLQRIPSADTDSMDAEETIQTYKRMSAELRAISDREAAVSPWGNETIYHLVLREITEIVTRVDLESSISDHGYLAPQTPYSTISDESRYPDITETVVWAQKALDAITGRDWLFLTWQIAPDQVHLSFH